MSQVEGHACDDDVGLEQECSLDEESALVVEQMVPPFRRHEYGFVTKVYRRSEEATANRPSPPSPLPAAR